LKSQRIISDNDGHWYIIPEDEDYDFYCWVNAMENNLEWDGKDFDDRRVNISAVRIQSWYER